MSFMNAVKNTLNEDFNYSVTENGAIGYRTSGKELVDLNFAVSSMRGMSEENIYNKFTKAYFEDKMMALRWLFFARDVRGGLGERRLFRVILKNMAKDDVDIVKHLAPIVSEYGRYDDLWCLFGTDVDGVILDIIKKQLTDDIANMADNKPVSLLAKWLPSVNASSTKTKMDARYICNNLGMTEREYRKTLSSLRSYIDIVESKMSAKKWEDIKYETVPSRANLIYNGAFLRNDEERRREYLSKLENGETNINAGTLFPHDIVHKYSSATGWYGGVGKYDATLESLWKALPDTVNECGNTIVVADGSGSMCCNVGGSSRVTALEVANALAIYFAEHSSGDFKDKYITFSSRPQLVDFSQCDSLRDKLRVAYSHSECSNTNIEKVFDLILTTAVNGHMKQEDMPKNVLIISDMEFDSCATCDGSARYGLNRPNAKLFKVIKKRFEDAGYQMPRLVFWNVNSRTGTIPVKENDLGVALVSGFSTNVCKMVMSGKTDPYECLVETLMSDRYDAVEAALKNS